MSYYEAEKDNKYKVFEKKLQNMMVKPNVLAAMAREGDSSGDLKQVSSFLSELMRIETENDQNP